MSGDILEGYMKILEESIQIESSQETNPDSGAQSQDSERDERQVSDVPLPVKKFKKKLEGWGRTFESQICDLETELEHERQEREADLADAERLQQSLKDQLNEFRLAESQLKSKAETLMSQLAVKTEEANVKQEQLESVMSKLKAWEVDTIEWQTRLDDAHDEIKNLQDDLGDSRQKFNALEADFKFLSSVNENLGESIEETKKKLSEREAVVAELQTGLEEFKRNGESMTRDLDQERQLRGELESKLLEADTRISKLLSEYERQHSDSETAFEQRDRHIDELQELAANQEKLLAAQESRLEQMKNDIEKSMLIEESARKETERLNMEMMENGGKLEEQQRVGEDLRRQLTIAEERLEVKEAELVQKTDTLRQLSTAVKSTQQPRKDPSVSSEGGGSDVSLAQLSEQLFAVVQRESEAKESLALAHREVEELRCEVERQTRRSEMVGEGKRQLEQRLEEMERVMGEERKQWKEERERGDTDRQELREV